MHTPLYLKKSLAHLGCDLTSRSRGTRLVGAFQEHDFHHGWRVAPASLLARPLYLTSDSEMS